MNGRMALFLFSHVFKPILLATIETHLEKQFVPPKVDHGGMVNLI